MICCAEMSVDPPRRWVPEKGLESELGVETSKVVLKEHGRNHRWEAGMGVEKQNERGYGRNERLWLTSNPASSLNVSLYAYNTTNACVHSKIAVLRNGTSPNGAMHGIGIGPEHIPIGGGRY